MTTLELSAPPPQGLGLVAPPMGYQTSSVGLVRRLALAVDPHFVGPLASRSHRYPAAAAENLSRAKYRASEASETLRGTM